MKAERTITVKELQELQKTAYHIQMLPKLNQVVVDGFKRFNATDYTLAQFSKDQLCTPSQY